MRLITVEQPLGPGNTGAWKHTYNSQALWSTVHTSRPHRNAKTSRLPVLPAEVQAIYWSLRFWWRAFHCNGSPEQVLSCRWQWTGPASRWERRQKERRSDQEYTCSTSLLLCHHPLMSFFPMLWASRLKKQLLFWYTICILLHARCSVWLLSSFILFLYYKGLSLVVSLVALTTRIKQNGN